MLRYFAMYVKTLFLLHFYHFSSYNMDYLIFFVTLQSKYDVRPKENVRLWGSTSCCRMAFRIMRRLSA